MQFAWVWIWLLAPLPFAVWFFMPKSETTASALKVPFYASLAEVSQQQKDTSDKLHLAMVSFIWICLLAAAARPQVVGEVTNVPVTGRDLMLAVDVSGSMKTADIPFNNQQQTRLDAVKRVAGEFIRERNGDRLGLILFGTKAYLQAPLTLDLQTVGELLEE